MDFLDRAHSCEHCWEIVFDGTGPPVELSLPFSYNYVKAVATKCLLLDWCLRRARGRAGPAHRLVLSTSQDFVESVHIDVSWKDEFGNTLSSGFAGDDTTLHGFALEGTSCSFT